MQRFFGKAFLLTSISQETSLDIIHNRLFEANSNWNQQLTVIPLFLLDSPVCYQLKSIFLGYFYDN